MCSVRSETGCRAAWLSSGIYFDIRPHQPCKLFIGDGQFQDAAAIWRVIIGLIIDDHRIWRQIKFLVGANAFIRTEQKGSALGKLLSGEFVDLRKVIPARQK